MLSRVCYPKRVWLNNSLRNRHSLDLKILFLKRTFVSGDPGAGAGKGGGAGGAIKESGGGLGKYGAAQEEGYFYNKSKEQLEKLKKVLKPDEGKKTEKKKE